MKHSKFKLSLQILFFLILSTGCFGQAVNTATPLLLKLNVPINGDFSTGETQTFALHLERNQLAELVLQRKGNYAQFFIRNPKDDEDLITPNFNQGIFSSERILFQNGDEPRDFLVDVLSGDKKSAADDKFALTLVKLKTPDARDKLRVDAQTALLKGVEFAVDQKSREKASAFFETALKISRESRDSLLEAYTLAQMQSLFLANNEMEKSIEYGKAALLLLDDQENNFNKIIIKNRIGVATINIGEIKPGIEILSENVIQLRQSGDRTFQIMALNFLSNGYSRLGDFEKSLEYGEQAYQIAKEIGDAVSQIQSLNSINRIYLNRGDFDKVLDNANKALALSNEQTLVYIPGIYSSLGATYLAIGQIPKAIENYRQAIVINRQVNGNKYNEATYLVNIADGYTMLGQTSRAIDYNRQAIELYNQAGNKNAIIAGLRANGSVYRALKEFEKAKQVYLEALKLSEPVGDKRLISILTASVGNTEYKLNHYESAIEYYLKSVKLAGELKLQRPELTGLSSLSNSFIESGQLEKGGEAAAQTLEKARAVGDRLTESNMLYNLARVRRGQKDLVGARSLIEDSLKIIESKRSELTNQESRTAYFSTVRDKYDFYISLLIEMQNQPENKHFGALAFAASEQARARNLLDLLAESSTDISSGIDPELKSREQTTQAKLSALQSRLISLKTAEKPDAVRINGLEKDIAQADEDRDQLEQEIRQKNPRYAELKYPATINLAQTQKLLDENTVLLEYQTGTDGSYLFAVGKNDFQIVPLPNGQNLRADVEALRSTIAQPSRIEMAKYLVKARGLYDTLLAPVENLLKNKTKIIVSTDGALNYLPFEVLLTGETAGNDFDKLPYLVRRFEISYTPSASILANLNKPESAAPKPLKSFLAFAAPDYGIEAADQNQVVRQATRAVSGNDLSWKLTALPNAKMEAERIAALFPAGQATVYTGADATEERAKSPELLSQYRYLHFAVHGLIDEEHPQFSSLVLSLPKTAVPDSQSVIRDSSSAANNPAPKTNNTDSALRTPNSAMTDPKSKIQNSKSIEDGLLQTPEIFNLRLRANMVTLSACETGLGQELRGEGIIGLTRAFFYAGASSVMVSLWSVSDSSTAELMTGFYEQLRKNGEHNKADALRQAQLKLIAGKRFAHPFYWAPFVLQRKSLEN